MAKSRRSKKRAYTAGHIELDYSRLVYVDRMQTGGDGEQYHVRHISSSEKTYTCPACLHSIPPFTSHVVVWAADHFFGEQIAAQERRHWHSSCWNRRLRPQ